jgi:stage V sporulation protein G
VEITQIRIFPVEEDKLKAFVSVVFDECFVVSDIKIIEGNQGLFVSMPSKKRKNGTFRDIAHPLNSETRRRFEEQIIARYREVLAGDGATPPPPLRSIPAGDDVAAPQRPEAAPEVAEAEEDTEAIDRRSGLGED